METTLTLDLEQVAREAGLSTAQVQATLSLLDAGNTVPFLGRYRKDQTGGLDESQIRDVEESVARHRALADRKQKTLKLLQAQNKLDDELRQRVLAANSASGVEDIYLPFKPKKQSLANSARTRGLEPLANEILAADAGAADLEARAAQFVNPDKELPGVSEVLEGVRHLVADHYSESLRLHDELRKLLLSTAKLVSSRLEESPPTQAAAAGGSADADDYAEADEESEEIGEEELEHLETPPVSETLPPAVSEPGAAEAVALATPEAVAVPEPGPVETLAGATGDSLPTDVPPADLAQSPQAQTPPVVAEVSVPLPPTTAAESQPIAPVAEPAPVAPPADTPAPAAAAEPAVTVASSPPPKPATPPPPKLTVKQLAAQSRKEAKRRKREKKIESFKEFFRYQEPLAKIPPHRLLAINRGERSKILRVRIEADQDSLARKAEELLVPPEHPHADFLRSCLRDALSRWVLPSLERELHRELTEQAEAHAVRVFARNLRRLLLQTPIHYRRVLAVDPGFRSGCKLAALDEFGDVLGHTVIHVIGKEDVVRKGRQQVVEMVRMYHIPVIAIGNGTACRETEQLLADILANELKDEDVRYVIVNEAGAAAYSTSTVGREELPKFDPVLRCAISLGRRLQDPLAELVKVGPSNIGVGLYQHDVKVKHLEEPLDAVVTSCVNMVGVDVNTAGPSLLRYVSGLNQLVARRLYDYRRQHGPFRNREQLKLVPGFNEATFTQAAAFLKITTGDNPLDATWIHPEHYALAERILAKLGGDLSELAAEVAKVRPPLPHRARTLAEFAAGLSGQAAPAASSAAASTPSVVAVDAAPPTPVTPAAGEPAPLTPEAAAVLPAAESSPPATAVEPAPVQLAELAAAPAAPGPESQVAPPSLPDTASAPVAASRSLAERVAQADAKALALDLNVGEFLVAEILAALAHPGRDPRADFPPQAFRRTVMKLDDLQPGMELTGSVLNVVDFGAFVDIGLSDSGLVHISRLADRFIRDPHEVVSVGDLLTVWVVEVDKNRRRVSLTAIKPGTETQREPRRPKPQEARPEARPPRPQPPRPQGQQGQQGQRGGRPPARRPQGGGRPQKSFQSPPPKPKPVRPITKAMEEGKEPMRSFSDLLQFYEKKGDGDEGENA